MADVFDFVEDDVIPVLEVRVLDAEKKTSFRVRRLSNFSTAETVEDLKKALKRYMPDIQSVSVENWKVGFVLERNKKFTIETDAELRDAWGHFHQGYQMCLDPLPTKTTPTKRQTTFIDQGDTTTENKQLRREDKILAQIEKLKEIHGNKLPPYKYRLWAEMIIVGTATVESMPDVPMFHATPAKRPRRQESVTSTITEVGQTIANALTPVALLPRHEAPNMEMRNTPTTENNKVMQRSEVIKQVRELFELKQMGAITEEEYQQKKDVLLKDL